MDNRAKTLVLLMLVGGMAAGVWTFLATGERDVRAVSPVALAPGGGDADPASPEDGVEEGDDDARPDSAPSIDEGRRTAVVTMPVETSEPEIEEGFDAQALYGTVEDPDGHPIADATLRLFPGRGDLDEIGPPLGEAESNGDGRFRFPDLERLEHYRIHVEADGFLPSLMGSRMTGVDKEITLRPSAPFAGRVLDALTGKPLAGVELTIRVPSWNGEAVGHETRVETDEGGAYAFAWAKLDGMQNVRVLREGFITIDRAFQVQEGRPTGYDIRLESGLAITGELYDVETGGPLANLEVVIRGQQNYVTDTAGTLAIRALDLDRLRDGKLTLDVRAEGWCRTYVTIQVGDGQVPLMIRVPMYRGARIEGVVKDPDGELLVEARVYHQNRNRQVNLPNLPPQTFFRGGANNVETDENGRFELSGIIPGTRAFKVTATHRDFAAKSEENITLARSGDVTELELKLASGAVIEGTVTRNGEPVKARVSWRTDDGTGRSGNARSNDGGQYLFRGVGPGLVKLNAREGEGFFNNPSEVDEEDLVVEDGQHYVHDIVISTRRTVIAGVVRDSSGEPVAGADIGAWAADESNDEWYYATAKSESDGSFELEVNDSPGLLYDLWASKGPRSASLSDIATGTRGIEILFPRLGKLRLEVVDAATHQDVKRYRVYYKTTAEPGKTGYQSLTQGGRDFSPGPDGWFEAELPVGRVDLRVSARSQGYPPKGLENVQVLESVEPTVERIALDKGVVLEVVLKAETPGLRLGRLILVSEEQQADVKEGWSNFSSTEIWNAQRLRPNDAGVATLKAMAPGRYSFWQPPKNLEFEPSEFTVPPVDRHRVEITYRKKPKKPEKKDDADKQALEGLDGLGYGGG